MFIYSIGVQLAWKISKYEALNKKSSFIEVDHIMLGILSLNKVIETLKNLPDIEYKNFHYEKEKLYSTLQNYDLNITPMRRNLRKALPEGDGLPSDNIYHRSRDCKQLFISAAQLANNYLTINHLFLTIIGWETSRARTILIKEKVDIDKLKSDIMFSFYKKN